MGCINFYSEFVYFVTNRAYLTISIPFCSYILRLSCAKNCFAYLHQFVFYYVSNGPLALDTTYPIGWVSCVIWWGNLYQCFVFQRLRLLPAKSTIRTFKREKHRYANKLVFY